MEIITHELYGYKIYHIKNVLNLEDFEFLQIDKQKFYGRAGPNGKKDIGETWWSHIKNYQIIDNWENKIGKAWVNYAKQMQEILKSLGINGRFMKHCVLQNNQPNGFPWHLHWPLPPTNDVNKFWTAVYYHHTFWDDECDRLYDGRLRVSPSNEDSGLNLPCYSNSAIIHNNAFGHCLDNINPGCPYIRESCYTEWRVF